MGEITTLLQRAREGERAAFDPLFGIPYPELHRIARARLGGHVRSTVMDTTVLVHECDLPIVFTGVDLAAGEAAWQRGDAPLPSPCSAAWPRPAPAARAGR